MNRVAVKLYSIRNWNELYENNRTRELKKLDWVPIPNKHDGDGYTLIMEHENGAAIFGAWTACIQIASRCDPRGTLMRDSRTPLQRPHDASSLARMSRIPVGVMQEMLDYCTSPVGWLSVEDYANPAGGCDFPAGGCDFPAGGCLEGKGREGKNNSTQTHKAVARYPSLEEAKAYGQVIGVAESTVAEFWNHFEASGWIDKNGHQIVNWQAKMATWKTNSQAAKLEAAHHARETPRAPETNGGISGADKMILGKELDRIIAQIKQLDDCASIDPFGTRQYTPEEKKRRKAMIDRRNELKNTLGIAY